jgi:hypothetical protein
MLESILLRVKGLPREYPPVKLLSSEDDYCTYSVHTVQSKLRAYVQHTNEFRECDNIPVHRRCQPSTVEGQKGTYRLAEASKQASKHNSLKDPKVLRANISVRRKSRGFASPSAALCRPRVLFY